MRAEIPLPGSLGVYPRRLQSARLSALTLLTASNGSYTVLAGGGLAAVNSAGTLAVGFTTRDAVYYKRNAVGDAWSGPFVLPGGCKKARGVDDAGHVVVMGCNARSRRA